MTAARTPAGRAYRPDIDGLRAVAVLAVVGFHAFPAQVNGGFVGVDVFFVISGFLISGVILRERQAGRFSFLAFYARRARRIFPALGLVLAAVLAFGGRRLLADDFRALGRSAAAGAAFLANVELWREAGYFDTAARLKPLLHLWSLGVEEQFYLAWPLLLVAVAGRRGRRPAAFWTVTALLAAASLAIDLWLTTTAPAAAFYLPPGRLWEFLAGAALAPTGLAGGTALPPAWRDRASLLGGAAIAAAVFGLNQRLAYPGLWAAAPALGAAAVIAAGPDAWLNRRLLRRPAMVAIGLISYPLYLWHWPALAFAAIETLGSATPALRLALVAASFIAAALTYLLVERPLRGLRLGAGRAQGRTLAAGLAGMAAIAAAGALAASGRLRLDLQRRSEVLSAARNYLQGKSEKEFWGDKSCFRFDDQDYSLFARNGCDRPRFPGRPTVFLVGDSHAAYLSRALAPYLARNGINLGGFYAGWCTPFSEHDARRPCREINAYVAGRIAAMRPDVVVMAANYIAYADAPEYGEALPIDRFVAARAHAFVDMGAGHVVVLGQMPTWRISLPAVLANYFVLKGLAVPERTPLGVTPASLAMDAGLRDAVRATSRDDRVRYLSLKDLLCNEAGCRTVVGAPRRDLVVFDYGHMTEAGGRYIIASGLSPMLQGILGAPLTL